MVSDAFPIRTRAMAMGVFTSAGALGGVVGLLGGRWLNQYWGWRTTFVAAGALGLLIRPLLLSIREPIRGGSDGALASPPPLPARQVIGRLRGNKTFPNLAMASMLTAFAGYSFSIWLPSFISRSYGLPSSQIGAYLGVINLVGGVGGTLGGAAVARWLGTRDLRWWMWTPAIGFIFAVPMSLIAIMSHHLAVTLACLFLTLGALLACSGPIFATLSTVTSPGMRTLAASSLLFFQITLGLGLGPLLTGWISDQLTRTLGQEGLRYALLTPVAAIAWGAIHYLLAARTIRRDAALAYEGAANPA